MFPLGILRLFLSALLVGCTGCRTGEHTDTTQGTTAAEPTPAAIDTLRGFVGDGTSMHVIELVNADATDTILLEIEDDADHRATLTVGNEIGVAVQQQPNGQQIVLATFDAE